MQPREKLKAKGPAALTNHELLKVLIGSGNAQIEVSKIASSALAVINRMGSGIDYAALKAVKGLGAAKITEILAAIELSRRYLIKAEQPIIDSPAKVADLLVDLANKRQEHFVVFTLDGANRIISRRTVAIGTLTAALVHPREVYADAIADRAAAIIVAHNHPSRSLVPSAEDIILTARLAQSAELLGIKLLDHILIAGPSSISLFKTQ